MFGEPVSSLDPELAHKAFGTIKEPAAEGQMMLNDKILREDAQLGARNKGCAAGNVITRE